MNQQQVGRVVCVLTVLFVCQVSLCELSRSQLESLLDRLNTAARGQSTSGDTWRPEVVWIICCCLFDVVDLLLFV